MNQNESSLTGNNYVLLFIISLLTVVYLIAEHSRFGDFTVFLDAGKRLGTGENIYTYNELNYFKYYYSPAFALFLSPLSAFDYTITVLFWKAFNIFLFYRLWKHLENKFLDFSVFTKTQKNIIQLVMFLSILTFISGTFHMVQMSVFLLYVMVEGTFLIVNKKKVLLGALLLAIAINIKIMPIVIVPYLIYRRAFSSVGLIFAFTLLLIFIPTFFIGSDYNQFLHAEWWDSINPLNKEHILDVNERGFHSLSALFGSLFTENLGNSSNLQIKRNILNLDLTSIEYLLNGVRLVLVLYTMRVLKFPIFSKIKSNLQLFYELSYLLIITPLIFPHQQVYGFLLVFPAFAYVIYNVSLEWIISKKLNLRMILLVIALLISNCIILLGFMREELYHFKVSTYGVLLMLALLIMYPISVCKNNMASLKKES